MSKICEKIEKKYPITWVSMNYYTYAATSIDYNWITSGGSASDDDHNWRTSGGSASDDNHQSSEDDV